MANIGKIIGVLSAIVVVAGGCGGDANDEVLSQATDGSQVTTTVPDSATQPTSAPTEVTAQASTPTTVAASTTAPATTPATTAPTTTSTTTTTTTAPVAVDVDRTSAQAVLERFIAAAIEGDRATAEALEVPGLAWSNYDFYQGEFEQTPRDSPTWRVGGCPEVGEIAECWWNGEDGDGGARLRQTEQGWAVDHPNSPYPWWYADNAEGTIELCVVGSEPVGVRSGIETTYPTVSTLEPGQCGITGYFPAMDEQTWVVRIDDTDSVYFLDVQDLEVAPDATLEPLYP